MFRAATGDDLVALRDLERTANAAALHHVFPPDRYPFPDDDVLARWVLVMDDPTVRVLVTDDETGAMIAFTAYDDSTVRHLAVHPAHWGEGLATEGLAAALHGMDLRGVTRAALWCLQENHRARRLYEYLGWRATTDLREAPWPPHPVAMRYTRLIVASQR